MTTDTKEKAPGGVSRARVQLARVVRLVFTLAAAVLALGALLVALRHDVNEANPVVRAVLDTADAIDGPLGRRDGIFDFTGTNALAKEAIVNWGIAAVVYLVVGRVLARLVRP